MNFLVLAIPTGHKLKLDTSDAPIINQISDIDLIGIG